MGSISLHSAQERPQEGGGPQLSPDTLTAAQEAAQAARDPVPQFTERAVVTQAKRDKVTRSLNRPQK